MKPPAKNPINPEKLLLSKWTAVVVRDKQKHFIVTRLHRDEQERVYGCVLEAVINHQEYELEWQVLKDRELWLPGWH